MLEQALGIALAGDQRPEDGAPAGAEQVGDHAGDLEVGVFQRLLDAQGVASHLANQLFAGARQVTQLLDRLGRHEARADQAVGQQVGEPVRIADVALASRDVAGVGGVDEE